MQSTIYVEMATGVTTEDLHKQLKLSYEVYLFMSLLVTSSLYMSLPLVSKNVMYELHYMPTNKKNAGLKMVFKWLFFIVVENVSSLNSPHHRRVFLTFKALSCLLLWVCGKCYLVFSLLRFMFQLLFVFFWWFRMKNLLWCWKMEPFLELTVWKGLITV